VSPAGPALGVEELRHVFKHVAAFDQSVDDLTRLWRIRQIAERPAQWRQLLAGIPVDKVSFHMEVGIRRSDAITRLTRWCASFALEDRSRQYTETFGYLSVLLLTLFTIDQAAEGATKSHDCALCRTLVATEAVRSALLDLYAPEPTEDAAAEWARIRPESLGFHRHGTTSLILSGHPEDPVSGRQTQFALKCVLFPYAKIPVVANKTSTYAAEHNARDNQGRTVRHMVHVWASTSRWILMDFAEGSTLAEELRLLKRETPPRRKPLEGNVRLDLIRRLGLPLLHALGELHAHGKRHEDLSPTNIIVRRVPIAGGGEGYEVTFIDFGRNYLYTRAVGGLDGPEGSYIAPEVREDIDDVGYADLYSLGRILVALGDVGENRDGTIPDRFYGQAPLIARFVEDLVDSDPRRRLIVFRLAPGERDVYGSLAVILREELDVTQAALVKESDDRNDAVPDGRETVGNALRQFFPLSREPKKQRRIRRVRKEQGVLGDPRRSMYARWLIFFSWLAAINFWVTAMVCVLWLCRDLGTDILNPPSQILLRQIGVRDGNVPFIDDLRRGDYRLGDVVTNLPARLVGLSFAFAAIRFYQNILSGVTARVAPGSVWSRMTTEFGIRFIAVWSSWLIIVANLVEPRWWPLLTAIGYTGTLVSDIALARFANRGLEKARERGFSTVPGRHLKVTGLDLLRSWPAMMGFYVVLVWGFGTAVYVGLLKDTFVYVLVVVLVNMVLLYMIACGTRALDVRIGLARCTIAAERLRCDDEVNSGPAVLPSAPAPVPAAVTSVTPLS
jgi:serine/threonine protein kinase